MNILQRSLIEKAGCETGWETASLESDGRILLTSARHNGRIYIELTPDRCYLVKTMSAAVTGELAQAFGAMITEAETFKAPDAGGLSKILHRAAQLYYSLPDQPARRFAGQVAREVAAFGPTEMKTEVERIVSQRLGQQEFRNSLLSYWKNACAVTSIKLPEVLRASHAKPWADCETDADRLNVFNGFLLVANLDALFDRGLITFDDEGRLLCSSQLSAPQKEALGLTASPGLRWLTSDHLPFLHWHQTSVFHK
ncbi:MAG: HNH endonuclease [Erysipelotrichia bacterium]|nr:HNH endonuclease [Erysipelotrichia bacterium]